MEITNITTSYTRKANHALYGGGQYESSDHFASLSAEVAEGEDIVVVENELRTACVEMVNQAILEEISTFQGGITAERFYTYLRDYVANRSVDSATYEDCNLAQKAILQAVKRGKQMGKRDTTPTMKTHHSLVNKDANKK